MATNISVTPNVLPPIPPNVAQIAAPLMFGILVSWLLYGMLVVQVYIYHIFFSDRKAIQAFVYVIFLLDTVQTCMMGADAFYWFCSGFGDMGHLSNVYISFFDVPLLGGFISLMVQSFFCYRVWILGKSNILPIFLWLVCVMAAAAAWFGGIRGHLTGNLSAAQAQINTRVLEVWLIGNAIVDTLIAGSLIYFLLRSRGSRKSTNAVLQRLVRITMETNSLSASLAILTLILYFAAPGTSYFLTPTYYFGKIYANSLLVTLNNRFFIANAKFSQTTAAQSGSGRHGTMSGTLASTLESGVNAAATSFKVSSFSKSVGAEFMDMTEYDSSPGLKTHVNVAQTVEVG